MPNPIMPLATDRLSAGKRDRANVTCYGTSWVGRPICQALGQPA
jgi:hypothetical protein